MKSAKCSLSYCSANIQFNLNQLLLLYIYIERYLYRYICLDTTKR